TLATFGSPTLLHEFLVLSTLLRAVEELKRRDTEVQRVEPDDPSEMGFNNHNKTPKT
ncbi:hypothetical protein AVEN_51188-1, partial [Araneus ventricosus]